jgi:hypothetical protein
MEFKDISASRIPMILVLFNPCCTCPSQQSTGVSFREEIDINNPFINNYDVSLDKKYPSIDIFYQKSTE